MKRRKHVEKYLSDLVAVLNLQDWEISVEYVDKPNEENADVGMDNTVDISYLRSTIKCYPIMENMDEEYTRNVLCHELCHIITEPMYSMCRANVNPHLYCFVEEQREQETERISRIALKALQDKK
jgi:hypothetical protein